MLVGLQALRAGNVSQILEVGKHIHAIEISRIKGYFHA